MFKCRLIYLTRVNTTPHTWRRSIDTTLDGDIQNITDFWWYWVLSLNTYNRLAVILILNFAVGSCFCCCIFVLKLF